MQSRLCHEPSRELHRLVPGVSQMAMERVISDSAWWLIVPYHIALMRSDCAIWIYAPISLVSEGRHDEKENGV